MGQRRGTRSLKGKSPREQPRPTRASKSSEGDSERTSQASASRSDLFDSRRQGARNVAGVTWQINVSVYLLVAGYASELPFVRITPEGFEDADCERLDGQSTFVQMKELADGKRTMTASGVADAIAHAAVTASGDAIAVVTNGSLGSQLRFTGWQQTLTQLENQDGVQDVISALVKGHGFTDTQGKKLVQRCHLIQLPSRVRDLTEVTLGNASGCHPSVASAATSLLTEQLTSIAAAQRTTTLATARRLAITDVESALMRSQESVDVSGLEVAHTKGVCEPADFTSASVSDARTFYLGVDGAPSHVGGRLDVPRQIELDACADGLRTENCVLIVGPSGCGKSILLWRAARDLMPSARIIRVKRVRDHEDADLLSRHVRLMQPREHSPVLVVADNLGRPELANWRQAVGQLRETPFVFILGAARSEDFAPELIVGTTRVVNPKLDEATAVSIGERISQARLATKMSVDEAIQRSNGLLMEFVALLTTGQRLRQVLADQVAHLTNPRRGLQRDAARLVAAAHTIGLALDANRLGSALVPDAPTDEVGDALQVLRDEHIVIDDGRFWKGLHELRSAILTDLLHQSPPPTLGVTWGRVLEIVEPSQRGWVLRRVADVDSSQLPDLAPVLRKLVGSSDATAHDVAILLEGAERADNMRYAQATLPTLQSERIPSMPLRDTIIFLYAIRNQGWEAPSISISNFDSTMNRLRLIAERLPARSDFNQTLEVVCEGVTELRLNEFLENSPPEDILRLLEAGREYLRVPLTFIQGLLSAINPSEISDAALWSRAIVASDIYIEEPQRDSAFKSVEDRALLMAMIDPSALALDVDADRGALRLTRLVPLDASTSIQLPWDIPSSRSSDALNDETLKMVQMLADACPELEKFELVTLSASGARYRVGDHEPGFKSMTRGALKNRASQRMAIGYQAAIQRATSSETWTELIECQIAAAAELVRLATEAPLRLKAADNARRRSAWLRGLERVRDSLAALKARPGVPVFDEQRALAVSDNEDRSADPVSEALLATANALHNLCEGHSRAAFDGVAAAVVIRGALVKLETAEGGNVAYGREGFLVPGELLNALKTLADLCAAMVYDPELPEKVIWSHPLDTTIRAVETTRQIVHQQAESVLQAALVDVPQVTIIRVSDPEPQLWALGDTGWLITVPIEILVFALAALDGWGADQRVAGGFRVVLLPTANTHKMPGANQSQGVAGMSLGMGFQLRRGTSGSPIPLTPEEVASWSAAGGVKEHPMRDGATEVRRILQICVEQSWLLARDRMRKLPTAARKSSLILELLADCEFKIDEQRLDTSDIDDLEAAVGCLVSHVRAEEAGATQLFLVDVISGTDSERTPTFEELQLHQAVQVMHLSQFIDLR